MCGRVGVEEYGRSDEREKRPQRHRSRSRSYNAHTPKLPHGTSDVQ